MLLHIEFIESPQTCDSILANDHEARDLVLSLGLTHCLEYGKPTMCMLSEVMNEPSSLSSGRVFGCRVVETCIWIGSNVVDSILQCGLGKAKGNRNRKWNPSLGNQA